MLDFVFFYRYFFGLVFFEKLFYGYVFKVGDILECIYEVGDIFNDLKGVILEIDVIFFDLNVYFVGFGLNYFLCCVME